MNSLLPPAGTLDVGLVEWIAGIVLVAAGLFALVKLPAFWRGGEPVANSKRIFAVFGEPWTSAMASAVPIASVAVPLMGIAMLVLFGREASAGSTQELLGTIGLLLFLPGLVGVALILSVLLLGWPKAVMTPELRSRRGILGDPLASAWSRLRSWRS